MAACARCGERNPEAARFCAPVEARRRLPPPSTRDPEDGDRPLLRRHGLDLARRAPGPGAGPARPFPLLRGVSGRPPAPRRHGREVHGRAACAGPTHRPSWHLAAADVTKSGDST